LASPFHFLLTNVSPFSWVTPTMFIYPTFMIEIALGRWTL
jgi:hypothetical protein